MNKILSNKFSLEILQKLSFTKEFYKAVEQRLISKGKFLQLDILPGEGCGGFTYEFNSKDGKPNDKYLILEKNKNIYFAINNDLLNFVEGGIIDFEQDIHKTGFIVKENPNAELTCSCNRSFSPKASFFDKIN